MKTLTTLILLFIGFCNIVSAQSDKVIDVSVIINDSTSRSFKTLRNKDSFEFTYKLVLLKKGAVFSSEMFKIDTIFYPQDIRGFVFEDGRIYVSEKIIMDGKEQHVFMEQLIKNDSVSIYSFSRSGEESFFMKERNALPVQIERDMEPFKTYLLNGIPVCDDLTKSTFDKMKLNRYDILNNYKALTNCNIRYAARNVSIGVMGGFALNMMEKNPTLGLTSDRGNSYIVGVFVDIPLSYKAFSIRPELFYQNESYRGKATTATFLPSPLEANYAFQRESLVMPIMFRYTNIDAQSKVLPYAELGVVGGYAAIRERFRVISKLKGGSDFYHLMDPISKFYYGVAIGGGAELEVIPNFTSYIGLRYMFTATDSKIRIHNIMMTVSVALF